MRYIVAIDRTGLHIAPVRSSYSPYRRYDFLVEKAIYTYGPEYVAAVDTDDKDEAVRIGKARILEHFPEARDLIQKGEQ